MYKTGSFATPCVIGGEEYRLIAKVRAHSINGMDVPFWFGYKQANGDWKSVELKDHVGRRVSLHIIFFLCHHNVLTINLFDRRHAYGIIITIKC